jgi:hypothetical protein
MELFPMRPSAAACPCSQRRAHTASAVAAHSDGDPAALVHVAGERCPRRPVACPVVSQCPSRPKCGGAVGSRRYPSSSRSPSQMPENVPRQAAISSQWSRVRHVVWKSVNSRAIRITTTQPYRLTQMPWTARVGRIGDAQK